MSVKVQYENKWKGIKGKYEGRAGLKKWEAEEVLLMGREMAYAGILNGFWEDRVTELALKQLRLYDDNHFMQKILFGEAYYFFQEKIKKDKNLKNRKTLEREDV